MGMRRIQTATVQAVLKGIFPAVTVKFIICLLTDIIR